MSGSILQEIAQIRKGKHFTIHSVNQNRYRLLVKEPNGDTTSYFFSTPIYCNDNRALVNRTFTKTGNGQTAKGSNTEIYRDDRQVTLRNQEGTAILRVSKKAAVRPTLNGVAMQYHGKECILPIHTDKPFLHLRSNTKTVVLMDDGTPFLSVSAIGVLGDSGIFTGPAKITCQKTDDQNFTVFFGKDQNKHGTFMFEVNLYEPKLFQDTTVESGNPEENNVFGGMAFLGKSDLFGRQWLYSKIDTDKIPELYSMEINQAIFHLPKYNRSGMSLAGYGLSGRFCSLGSNWNNRIQEAGPVLNAVSSGKYYSLDITRHISDKKTGTYRITDGLVILARGEESFRGNEYAAVATADSYVTP